MNVIVKFSLVAIASAALGAAMVQELQAQAKRKAYSVTEVELLDAAAQAAYGPLQQAAVKAAGGRGLGTGGGKIVASVGPAPKRVVINEWDSFEQAVAFFDSKAYKDLAPQREKSAKTIRRYVVESAN